MSLANAKTLDINAEEVLTFCEGYLTAPSSVWAKAGLQTKIKLQRFQFPSGVRFDGNSFATPELSLVSSVSGGSEEKSSLRWTEGYWKFLRRLRMTEGAER